MNAFRKVNELQVKNHPIIVYDKFKKEILYFDHY